MANWLARSRRRILLTGIKSLGWKHRTIPPFLEREKCVSNSLISSMPDFPFFKEKRNSSFPIPIGETTPIPVIQIRSIMLFPGPYSAHSNIDFNVIGEIPISKSQMNSNYPIYPPLTLALFPRRLCRNNKNRVQTRWKRRLRMLGGLPGSGLSNDKRDASQSLRPACAKPLRRRQGGNLLHVRSRRSISLI
jgi:hypothetical protein